jgi:hypothetical protein
MVTLTYLENMQDARAAKKHLHAFAQALHRSYPGAGYIWKMECQKRGAIHFHLLVFGIRFLPWEWVAEAWTRIVIHPGLSIEQMNHQLQAGTQCKAAKSLWEAKSYLEKYLGKTDQTGELDSPGRWWGTHSLERYQAPVVEAPLTPSQVVTMARNLDKLHRASIYSAWAKRAKVDVGYHHRCTSWLLPHTWMISWAKRRKKNVLEQSTYWTYDAQNTVEPLLKHVYGKEVITPHEEG